MSEATSLDWVAAAAWVGAAAKRQTVTRRDHIKVLGVATGKTANSPHPAGMFRVFGDKFRSFLVVFAYGHRLTGFNVENSPGKVARFASFVAEHLPWSRVTACHTELL